MWPKPFLGQLHCDPDLQNYRHFAVEEPTLGFQIGGHFSSLVKGERKKTKGPNWMEGKPWELINLLRQLWGTQVPVGLCHLTLGCVLASLRYQ